ncbi:hypothetical protein V9T40_014250 [Parthenolecanium corni]|uniref:NADH dehydrogenase [ubiquinone] 1 alpha subcomplex subunit 5 n=1 Tax=Parthenolecanium corni TaxID=536013 RepID=A0AAN9TG11_9HEMI
MASVLKKTTGLTGLKVVNNPEHRLQIVYGKVLRALQKIPPHAAYRKYTEELVNTRLQIVKESKTIEEIESKINGGQVEELIRQGELEVVVARRFSLFKPWEELTAHPPKNQWTWPPTK